MTGPREDRLRLGDDLGDEERPAERTDVMVLGPADADRADVGTTYWEPDTSLSADATSVGEDGTVKTEAIVSDIEQTREEMSGTIEAIGAKLDPQVLLEQAKDTAGNVVDQATETVRDAASSAVDTARQTVRDATVGRVENMVQSATETAQQTTGGLIETIRQNPLPAAMAGLGLFMLWQAANKSGGTSSYRGADTRNRYVSGGYDAYGGGNYDASGRGGGIQATAGNAIGRAQETAGNALGTVQQTAGNVIGTAQETAGTVVGTAQETAGNVIGTAQQTAGNVIGTVQETAARAPGQIQRVLEENPLGAGLVAVAVGATAALVLPTTRKEQELYGGPRDAAIGKAQEQLEGAMDRAQESMAR